MTEKRSLDHLPPPERPAYRSEVSKAIEAQAGAAYTEFFWIQQVNTPLGILSRRAIALMAAGSLSFFLIFAALIWGRLNAIPEPLPLPKADANTVMTHVYANFSGQKVSNFELFFPPPNDTWLFEDAYIFTWRDATGTEQQVLVLSYPSTLQLQKDYYLYTRTVVFDRQQEAVARTNDLEIENRGTTAYGSLWKGFYIGNVMLLMSPQTDEAHQQELYSHLLSIMAAGQRDMIPSPTPF